MTKDNRICLRINDEVLSIIQSCQGNNLSAKFENMIYNYSREAPELEQKKENIKKRIAEMRKELDKLREELKKADKINEIVKRCLRDLEYNCNV